MIILAGLLFTLLFFAVMGAWCQLDFYRLVDIESLLIIAVPLLLFLAITKSGKTICRYIKSSFIKDYDFSKFELVSIKIAAKNGSIFTLAVGLLGFFWGLNSILSHLYFDESGWLGVMMSSIQMNFLVIIYSIAIVAFVLFPLKTWADNKANDV